MQSGYKENLEELREVFGSEAMIPIGRAAEYLGTDRRTLLHDKTFPVRKIGDQYRVPVVNLARWLNV